MTTLRLRNVPDAVVRRLHRLAEREGVSVSALAVRELSRVSQRADRVELMDSLPNLAIDVSDLARGLDEERLTR